MILWRFKEQPETRGESYPYSAFRWTLQIGWAFIGFVFQSKERNTGEWDDAGVNEIVARIWRRFAFGFTHTYWDGPNCQLSLGFLHLCWRGNPWTGDCKKCMPDEVSK